MGDFSLSYGQFAGTETWCEACGIELAVEWMGGEAVCRGCGSGGFDLDEDIEEEEEDEEALQEFQRYLVSKAVNAQTAKADAERELEEVKKQFRVWSEGEKTRWTEPNIGEVLVGAAKWEALQVEEEALKQLEDQQLGWLIRQGILRVTVVESEFTKLKDDIQDRILRTGCVKKTDLSQDNGRQRVVIRAPNTRVPPKRRQPANDGGEPGGYDSN